MGIILTLEQVFTVFNSFSNEIVASIIYMLQPDDHVTLSHNMTQIPDHVVAAPGHSVNKSAEPLDASLNVNGDWSFDDTTTYMSYLGRNLFLYYRAIYV